jgi:hypothetical protein
MSIEKPIMDQPEATRQETERADRIAKRRRQQRKHAAGQIVGGAVALVGLGLFAKEAVDVVPKAVEAITSPDYTAPDRGVSFKDGNSIRVEIGARALHTDQRTEESSRLSFVGNHAWERAAESAPEGQEYWKYKTVEGDNPWIIAGRQAAIVDSTGRPLSDGNGGFVVDETERQRVMNRIVVQIPDGDTLLPGVVLDVAPHDDPILDNPESGIYNDPRVQVIQEAPQK